MASKTPHGKSMLYVKAASMMDLCRYCCGYDFNTDMLLRTKEGKETRIMALGEQIGDVTLGYYVESEGKGSIISYKFPEYGKGPESMEFVNSIEQQPGNYISVIDLDLKGMKKAKEASSKDIMLMRMEKPESMINAAIRKGLRGEALPYLYSFAVKGYTVLCGFDLIDGLNDEKRMLYYTVMGKKKDEGFLRWSYTANRFDFVDVIGEYSYIYVKIINLAGPFSFFKMPD
ncbi:MAG: hypothetical protein KGH69_01205 [Candidatus Micrarchaeota archaeon]|nr:hypothetical protein [Candidatus Micrarchaeota archaeon]MDE1851292.1 hypothetical protein [Candidatus Micrarchaeota archaeon]